MSRIFLSHSSKNNAQALALRDWLASQGWHDVFLDIDPERGLVAADRWQRALRSAIGRCKAVIYLISNAWLDSDNCKSELDGAGYVGAEPLGILIEDVDRKRIPSELSGERQMPRLFRGGTPRAFVVAPPPKREPIEVVFPDEELRNLRAGLARLGLVGFDTESFPWPPAEEPERTPFRGFEAFDVKDAGVFFGRDTDLVHAREALIELRRKGGRKLFTIVGASGSGKSSFLRAGLWPRLEREDRDFITLPLVRPSTAALSGANGLGASLEQAFQQLRQPRPLGDLIAELERDHHALPPLLNGLQVLAMQRLVGGAKPQVDHPPTLVLPIDQAEELFAPNADSEAGRLRQHLATALTRGPDTIGLLTIRSDQFSQLQSDEFLGPLLEPFNLAPVPATIYRDAIVRPAARIVPPLEIDPLLTSALIRDTAAEGADPLPLLAFTLERLFRSYGKAKGGLRLQHYAELGGIGGSIDRALAEALKKAGATGVSENLRRLIVPGLATWDQTANAARRLVPLEVDLIGQDQTGLAPLADALVEARLFTRGRETIEVAHEALLRRAPIAGWLDEQKDSLKLRDEVLREAGEWARKRQATDLVRRGERLKSALDLCSHPGFISALVPAKDYLAACQTVERAARWAARRTWTAIFTLMLGIIAGLIAFINEVYLKEHWFWAMKVRPYVLTAKAEAALKPDGAPFKECADCPEMVVMPAGTFVMGSPDGKTAIIGLDGKPKPSVLAPEEDGRADDEGPQHEVTIAKSLAVSKFEVTHDQWQLCVDYGGCPTAAGKGNLPAASVSWDDARFYAAWLSKMTGKTYRLLTEAEWEYAARAGTTTVYSFDDSNSQLGDYAWFSENSGRQAHRVGEKKPNAFGLYDMHGNIYEWVEDCYQKSYDGAPADGSARTSAECSDRVVRGGSWESGHPQGLRSANRYSLEPTFRINVIGFRLARTL